MDHFSYLPEAVIFIILSFLPFKDAVKTSILARRWRRFWHAAGNIDLDERFFVRYDSPEHVIASQRRDYMQFIHHWMDNCQAPQLRTFRVVFSGVAPGSLHVPDMQRCIEFIAGKCGETTTGIDVDFSSPFWDVQDHSRNPQTVIQLPSFESTHATLESLQLSACRFDFLRCNSFARMKTVHLGWMDLPTLNRIIQMCPLLEDLQLKRCWNVRNMMISAARLKVLVIDTCTGPESITIDAPMLNIFKYHGLATAYMTMDYHRYMEEMVFDFGLQSEIADQGDGEMFYNLLSETFSVRVLTVCSYMLQVLPMCEEPLSMNPKLENVRHLILKTQLHVKEFYGITFFLNSCPNLELLEIELGAKMIFEECEPPFRQEEHPFLIHDEHPLVLYRCLSRTLRTVKVKGFKGTNDEMIVLTYLLKFGFVLENLYIHLSKEKGADGIDMEATYRANLRRLIRMGTASPCLQVYTIRD